jgi:predicted O-methyltransferase YrrM
MGLLHVVRNATTNGHFRVVWDKVVARFRREYADAAAAGEWCASMAVYEDRFAAVDTRLWSEATSVVSRLEQTAEPTLRSLRFDVAGNGGHCALLYFLARLIQPAAVLETGVAAGYSSAALLTALDRNGTGHLYSSDFPYLRIRDPARHIGCLVENRLRSKWTLELRGDRINVPLLLAKAGEIVLFHYDSDKSYSAREWVFARVVPKLASRAVVVMDDVQDNLFFRDWVECSGLPFVVLPFRNKYVGVASRRLEEEPLAGGGTERGPAG